MLRGTATVSIFTCGYRFLFMDDFRFRYTAADEFRADAERQIRLVHDVYEDLTAHHR